MRIQTGDTVLIITGKDKGKTGSVLRVLGDRLVVSDANMRTRHVRKTAQGPGQRLRYEASIAACNVMVLDPKTKKPTRIGIRKDDKGHNIRFAKVSGEAIVAGTVASKKGPKAAPLRKKEGEESVEAQKTEEASGNEIRQVSAPPKKPFWKKLSFGAEAVADIEDPKARVPDRSVPEETRIPESFQHGRGS